jgi:hypothetical protein
VPKLACRSAGQFERAANVLELSGPARSHPARTGVAGPLEFHVSPRAAPPTPNQQSRGPQPHRRRPRGSTPKPQKKPQPQTRTSSAPEGRRTARPQATYARRKGRTYLRSRRHSRSDVRRRARIRRYFLPQSLRSPARHRPLLAPRYRLGAPPGANVQCVRGAEPAQILQPLEFMPGSASPSRAG